MLRSVNHYARMFNYNVIVVTPPPVKSGVCATQKQLHVQIAGNFLFSNRMINVGNK